MVGTVHKLLVVGVVVGTFACSRKTAEPAHALARTKAPVTGASEVSGESKLDSKDPKHGTRKLKGLDVPVYVDGVQISVLRYGETPAISTITSEAGTQRYRLVDYLAAVGVAPESIASVHVHGNGDRIGSVEGSELLQEKNRFLYSFASGETGNPLVKWSSSGLKNEFVVHEIRRVTVYVKKPSPAISKTKQCHVGADGDCSDAVPYASGEVAKGTRIYLDGKMVGFVKRRLIGNDVVAGDLPDGEHTYSVSKLIAQMGVDPAGLRSVELLAGDEVVARADGEQFTTLASKTTFTLPKHNHGKVRIHVPAEIQARGPGVTDCDAMVSAVLLYKSTAPAAGRDLVSISEDTDLSVQLAAIDDARGKPGREEH